ncbi:pseudouridine synthase [Novisyntrophococcus fermenticellae]|uniref:pseudouridine synthase n=1 Tax=Novisyntrophococcus fermenticellae TaxID=2068655 RepID=UPI002F409704
MKEIRLDKYLADMGLGTRSQVKSLIRKGHVRVEEKIVKSPEYKVGLRDEVTVGGNRVTYKSYEYLMLHKPRGVVSATEDKKERTVLDLIAETSRKDLFPVGRLDKDTEGLLLLTNDGALAHELLSPKKHVDKKYFAKVRGILTESEVQIFARGLDIGDDKPTLPAKLKILNADADISEIEVTIQEGRFHQVKRMFEAVGCRVVYLKRLSMGSLILDEKLRPGEYRSLTEEETAELRK